MSHFLSAHPIVKIPVDCTTCPAITVLIYFHVFPDHLFISSDVIIIDRAMFPIYLNIECGTINRGGKMGLERLNFACH